MKQSAALFISSMIIEAANQQKLDSLFTRLNMLSMEKDPAKTIGPDELSNIHGAKIIHVLFNVETKEKQKLEDAAISLQTSRNPHFTFNALSTIQGLINTGKIDDANNYLQEFGTLLRKTLIKSQEVYNTLDQQMEMMRLYLRIDY